MIFLTQLLCVLHLCELSWPVCHMAIVSLSYFMSMLFHEQLFFLRISDGHSICPSQGCSECPELIHANLPQASLSVRTGAAPTWLSRGSYWRALQLACIQDCLHLGFELPFVIDTFCVEYPLFEVHVSCLNSPLHCSNLCKLGCRRTQKPEWSYDWELLWDLCSLGRFF